MDVEVAEGGFGSGPEPEGPGPRAGAGLRLLGWVAGAVVLLVVGYLALSHQSSGGTSAAVPGATASMAPDGGTEQDPYLNHPWESPAPINYLSVGDICPVSTNGRTSMRVSFQLTNPSPAAIAVVSIRPDLPLGGLRPSGPMTAGGSCAHPGAAPARGPLQPGETKLYSMTLRLPKACPQPLPVGLIYRVRPDDSGVPQQAILFNDLGSVDFDSCPARTRQL